MKSVNTKLVLQEKIVNPFRFQSKHPDFRFQCPNCGSLDVLISWENENTPIKGKCLDCTKIWLEGMRT